MVELRQNTPRPGVGLTTLVSQVFRESFQIRNRTSWSTARAGSPDAHVSATPVALWQVKHRLQIITFYLPVIATKKYSKGIGSHSVLPGFGRQVSQ